MTDMPATALFDAETYLDINAARWTVAERVLTALSAQGLAPKTAYDFGAGPGWFASRLTDHGLDVLALEGRQDVIQAGQERAPKARFEQFDFDGQISLAGLPARDFGLAFGILYHLENPLRALRLMGEMTSGALLLETMVLPRKDTMAQVIRENANPTQGIRPLAMLLSPLAIEQGLWAAGFTHVYRFMLAVDHSDFEDQPERHPRRGIWLAARNPLVVEGFERQNIKEPTRGNYWLK
jgi:SAM-dependent methyltransferase